MRWGLGDFLLQAILVIGASQTCLAQRQSAPLTLENLLDETEQPPPQHQPQLPAVGAPTPDTQPSIKSAFEDGPITVDGDEGPQRQAIPEKAAVKQAQDLIRDAYGDEFARSVDNPEPLVRKLLDAAEQTTVPARKYAALLEAEQVAVAAGDVERAISLIQTRAETFQIDVVSESIACLKDFLHDNRTANPSLLGGLMEQSLALKNRAFACGRLEEAVAALEIASTASQAVAQAAAKKKLKDPQLIAAASDVSKRASEYSRAIRRRIKTRDDVVNATKTLESAPEDAVANGIVGAYDCFVIGRWGRGVERLAKSDRAELKDIAAEEHRLRGLEEPMARDVFQVAGRWWGAAEATDVDAETADAIHRHAAKLYAAVLASLSDPLDIQVATKRAAAHAVTAAEPAANHIASKPLLRNSIGIDMKLIPAGTFQMGSNDGEANEMPVHEVRITKHFYLGVTEVTNAQWKAVMGNVPSKWKDDDRPVEQVSWDDAVKFCEKLSALPPERKAGRVYRLPTEAEWEYACRARTETLYSFGDGMVGLREVAWFGDNSGVQYLDTQSLYERDRTNFDMFLAANQCQPHAVAQKKPNSWGLFDMHGNVWEWCSDWYGSYHQTKETDPVGPAGGSQRVMRGGAWDARALRCRSAHRAWDPPATRGQPLGFRVALSWSGTSAPDAGK